jgi:hypothetical protein
LRGVIQARVKGAPLRSLLANKYLDALDKKLERRAPSFVR